jgi:hypothetical protein
VLLSAVVPAGWSRLARLSNEFVAFQRKKPRRIRLNISLLEHSCMQTRLDLCLTIRLSCPRRARAVTIVFTCGISVVLIEKVLHCSILKLT